MHLIPLFSRLFLYGIRYRYYRFMGSTVWPQALSMEITRRCVAKCLMCNIWKTPAGNKELTAEEWLNLLSSPVLGDLRELDITGGEPFLKEDLLELLAGVFDLKDTNLKSLRSVAITTNGFLTDKIIPLISEAALLGKDRNVGIVIVFAMDGIGPIHDQIRRVKGGWQRLDKSIQEMKKIKSLYGNVILGLKTTLLPMNVGELDAIASYADENELFTIISPFIITRNRYDNEELAKSLYFNPNDIERIIAFFESPRFMWDYHREMLVNFFRGGRVAKPCSAGYNYFFVRSNGELFPCPLIKEGLGNVDKDPFNGLISSSKAIQFRRKIGAYEECRSCTEPGLERYALPFEGFHYLKMLFKAGGKRFLSLHEHMGLDKYTQARTT
jgi:MoaA/NifB/PqqE/SkfB family radical SAM enzyme